MTSPWVVLGAPFDCSGRSRGEEQAPAALREAGLVERIGATDGGDMDAWLHDSARDAHTGIIGYSRVLEVLETVRAAVEEACARGTRPLVLGGDCGVLVGAAAGARRSLGRLGLVLLDGHVDFHDGRSSNTGELADMDIALVTGYGPNALVELGGAGPIVRPGDTVIVGYRRESDNPHLPNEYERVDPRIQLVEGSAVRRGDAGLLGEAVAERLARQAGRYWVHFDVDVLDAALGPAVTYPQPGGIGWEETAALLRPLLELPELAGLSVTDFVPPRDRDGAQARRLVELLGGALPRSL